MKHRLSEIDEVKRRATCSVCGYTKIAVRDHKLKNPISRYRCYSIHKSKQRKRERPYIVHKKEFCENCGFTPEHSSQLDVDHIDNDHHNNDPANLQTLCANCHRLKTHLHNHKKFSIFKPQKKKPPTQDFS